MKKSPKPKKSAKISYKAYMYMGNVGNSQADICHSNVEEEFKDRSPLIARKKAFEYIEKLQKGLHDASNLGIINLASYEEAEQMGFTNFTKHSITIQCVVTDDYGNLVSNELINNYEGQETAIWGLELEYYYYQQYGYETGEIMKLDEGEIILQTDPAYIYD